MAKISISSVFKRQKRIRIVTTLCLALVVLALGQMLISNPRNSLGANGPGDVDGIGTNDDYIIDTDATLYSMGDGWININGTNAGARILPNNNTRSIRITNGAVVTLVSYHSLDLVDLIIEKGSSLTHGVLVPTTDFDTTTSAITPTGIPKRVDLNISRYLRLMTGGKIDVSERGYPGAPSGANNGYGPGKGYGVNHYGNGSAGGGGGSYAGAGGRGCDSFINDWGGGCTGYGTASDTFTSDPTNPTYYGSGGGGAHEDDSGYARGGMAGGGRVIISSASVFIDNNSGIYANGGSGSGGSSVQQGAGSGGSIVLTTTNLYTRIDSSYTGPKSDGGTTVDIKGDATMNGGAGSVYYVNASGNWGDLIQANGGNGYQHSGSGGGGRIKLDIANAKQICHITKGDIIDYIPAECDTRNPLYDPENGEVVLDGYNPANPADTSGVTVYADSDPSPVWQSDGTLNSVCPVDTIIDSGHTYFSIGYWTRTGVWNNMCNYASYFSGSWHDLTRPYSTLAYSAGEYCNQYPFVQGGISYRLIGGSYGSGLSSCDTKRSFSNLTILNNATLTHNPLTVAEAVAAGVTITDDTTGTGRWKKVDVEVTGDVKIIAGGKINVDGKGYPGGQKSTGDNWGYGPLRGGGNIAGGYNSIIAGQGGGNGGIGGDGYNLTTTFDQSLELDTSLDNFDFGSGGGAAWYRSQSRGSDGTAGGGRIAIKTNNITIDSSSQISANGVTQTSRSCYDCSNEGAAGGSGGGGTVKIYFSGTFDSDFTTTPTVSSGNYAGVASGNIGQLEFVIPSVAFIPAPIYANGGNQLPARGSLLDRGGGGGGRILISKLDNPRVSIHKELIAVNRPYNAVPVNTNFNPYALQKDDLIQVKLTLGVFTDLVTITDDWLKIPSTTTKCAYYSDATHLPSPRTPDAIVDPVVWMDIPTTDPSGTVLYYYCKVQ